MRVAIASDIHGNKHAFQAVIRGAEADGADELWCLGDLVGYGPWPNEVIGLVRDRADLCLVGQHRAVAEHESRRAGPPSGWNGSTSPGDRWWPATGTAVPV